MADRHEPTQLELAALGGDGPRPRAKAKRKDAPTLTTAQRLGSVVKSARDIMRKDKGLNGDLDRLPMLTWIMFLKFLDDMEFAARRREAKLGGRSLSPGHRAALPLARLGRRTPDGITGDELLAFINNDEATRPDGTKGPGLFAYLRGLQGQRRRPPRRDRQRLPRRRSTG